jgi:hypothetical protein
MASKWNFDPTAYAKPGVNSYFLRDQMTFIIGGVPKKVLTCGTGCGLGPVYLLENFEVYIGVPSCGSLAASSAWHMEGPISVPDYSSNVVTADGGMLFAVKPAWYSHFQGVIGFAPIPLLPI